MENAGVRPSRHDLSRHGLQHVQTAYWNLGSAQLIEKAIQRREGMLSSNGAFVVRTGQFTGRSPKDKYIVREAGTENTVNWGSVNQPMTEAQFDGLFQRMLQFWEGQDVFVQDCFAGADPNNTMPIRVIAQRAWHALFARQLFVRPDPMKTEDHVPEFTLFFAPTFYANPEKDGTRSQTAIVINYAKKMVLIAGTEYAGEMKKSVFTILNYLLTFKDIMPMHCSANVGDDGRVALFFGLSGTGKTTLSADSATMSTAGATRASSISKAAATRSAFTFRRKKNRRSGMRSASAPCLKTWRWTRISGRSISARMSSRKIRAPRIRSSSSITR